MNYFKPNVTIIGKWEKEIEKFPYVFCNDYDLKNAITACAIKSATGEIQDLYKSEQEDIPSNYKYTRLMEIPIINRVVDYFKFDTTRVRVFKQEPKHSTPMHIDKDDPSIIRMWMALNEDENFKFFFGEEKEEIILKTGEIVFFNPNYLHGAANLSNKNRYTLNICGNPNKWIKELLEVRDKVIFL